MEQKFVNFEEALEKLGINSDRLNELREHGQLRAYRDGSSWKFRADEINAMVEGGVPDPPPPSDIGLVDEDDLVDASPLDLSDDDDDLELLLADEESSELSSDDEPVLEVDSELELDLDDTDAVSQGSELDLGAMEDTVTAEENELELDLPDLPGEASDSILLSEEELGESVSGSPSTIIGKSELASEEADLELSLDDDEGSDVSLASGAGASDVLSSGIAGSGVLDELTESSGGLSAFEDLEELEIDLSAESSRILSPEDVEKVRETAKAPEPLATDNDDLKLEDDDEMGSTDVPLEELEPVAEADDDDLELDLATDDALVDDGSGSDITLDSGDSGINLISPSDSGLALDDIPLDVGGSAILSSLSLEGSDPEISLIGDSDVGPSGSQAELQTDDDFQLTPLSEGGQEDDGDSSSQVIALDAGIDEVGAEVSGMLEGEAGGMLSGIDFTEEGEAGAMMGEDIGGASMSGLTSGYADPGAAAVPASPEQPYTIGNVVFLSACTIMMLLTGLMGIDIVRNMWSWDENLSINSALLDALSSLL